jgi:hypothetical protein
MRPAKGKFTVLKQICELIPRNLVARLSAKHGVDRQSRSFRPWSHVVSMLFAQLAHALSLNDVCDTLGNHSGALAAIRRATPPSRNGLSHANRARSAAMMEELFWETLGHLRRLTPGFGSGNGYVGLPRRFRRIVNVIDSTTISLVANCMDWAKHRRRKAAAKMHLRLNLQSFLPGFALVKAGNTHDATEARRVCAGIQDGEIAVFDKAYLDFEHLAELDERGIFWVSRAKENMQYEVVRERSSAKGRILRDAVVRPAVAKTRAAYPGELRLVEAMVEMADGSEQTMTFLTNNLEWAASSICDLYKARWGIEAFFKQIKQTLKLSDFLGYSENAVLWQVWSALLTYVLLRFLGHTSKWRGSFSRLFTVLRGVMWSRLDLFGVLACCGTASDPPRMCAMPQQAYLPGFG